MAADQVVQAGRDPTVQVQAEPPVLTPSAAVVLLRILLKAARRRGPPIGDAGTRGDPRVRSSG